MEDTFDEKLDKLEQELINLKIPYTRNDCNFSVALIFHDDFMKIVKKYELYGNQEISKKI